MRLHTFLASVALVAMPMMIIGCSTSETTPPVKVASSPSAEGKSYVLAAEPADAKGVKQTRDDAKDSDEITIVGRIGGDAKPWVEDQAAFMLVDSALKPCADEEGCPTPWDYCCSTDLLPDNKAMVKFVDAEGKTVATDARKLLGVKELQTVVIHGKAKRDEAGNLTVLADGIFVRQ
jgi:hypothetical protein